MTVHRPPQQITAALHAGSILPDAVLDRVLGFSRLDRAEVRFVQPGQTSPAEGPFLRLRPPTRGHNSGVWYIEDRTSAFERDVLGQMDHRYRRTTGFREGEEEQAALRLILYVELKRNKLLGTLLPTQVSVAVILRSFLDHLDAGGNGLSRSTIHSYRTYLVPLTSFFGGLRLGSINSASCAAYQRWRLDQDATPNGYHPRVRRKVSLKTVACELAALARAINLYKKGARLNLVMDIPIPEAPKPPVTWLPRKDFARYLWALRGRIWSVDANRWRVLRDDDPSLTGPEGDRRVLRAPEVRKHRAMLARLFILGVYTGGRHASLLQATYLEADKASVDWVRGALARKAAHEKENNKRRPAVLLVPKLARFIRNWARNDRALGITHLIHHGDGKPYARRLDAKNWRAIDVDAGVGTHVTAHVLRHTCAMWLKGENVSLWGAANFIGCSTKVLEERYGTWDFHTQVEAVGALSTMGRHRQAQRMLRDLDIA